MTVLARRTDPITSHMAASRAAVFSGKHTARILAGLQELGDATAHELCDCTGLTVVQIDRRLPEMARQGTVRVQVRDGVTVVRGGARVWEAI